MSNRILQKNLCRMYQEIQRLDLLAKQCEIGKTSNIVAVREAVNRRFQYQAPIAFPHVWEKWRKEYKVGPKCFLQ